MNTILISIKPQFVEQIRKGVKVYEYRKVFNSESVGKKMLIYSSYPVKMIVAECKIKSIIKDAPEFVWEATCALSGISKSFYDEYFNGRVYAQAIELSEIQFYANPISLQDLGVKRAPQSYMFVDSNSY